MPRRKTSKRASAKTGAAQNIERVKLYVEGFDKELQGGVPKGYVTLLSGIAGTMKSSLALNVLYNEALAGRNSVYITLEQSAESLVSHFSNMGYDWSKVNLVINADRYELKRQLQQKSGKGTVVIADISAMRQGVKKLKPRLAPDSNWLQVIKDIARDVKDNGCELFVLDSLSALYILTKFENPRTELFYFFNYFRELGITSFFVSEMPLDKSQYGAYGVEDFLVDAVIALDLARRERKVTREIRVVKMRGTDCNVNIFSMEFERSRFKALYGGQTPLI